MNEANSVIARQETEISTHKRFNDERDEADRKQLESESDKEELIKEEAFEDALALMMRGECLYCAATFKKISTMVTHYQLGHSSNAKPRPTHEWRN